MAAENIKIGSSPYNFIHELIVYIVSSPVTSKNKSSLHTFLFSWSTMSGTSVGNFVQSCATEKTRNPQNTNRSSQPHCLSIFLYFNKQFRKSMWCPFQPTGKYQKKNSVFNRKISGFFRIRLIAVGCAPAGGTAPAPATLQSAPLVEKMPKKGENPRNSQRYREKLNLSESFLGQSILNVNYVFATWHYLNIQFERLQEKVASFPSKQRTSCKCSSAMTGKKGESRTDDLPMTKGKMSGCHCSVCWSAEVGPLMGPVGPLMWQIGYPYREKQLTFQLVGFPISLCHIYGQIWPAPMCFFQGWGAAQPPQLQSPAKTTIGEASDIGGKVPLEPFPKFRKCVQTWSGWWSMS